MNIKRVPRSISITSQLERIFRLFDSIRRDLTRPKNRLIDDNFLYWRLFQLLLYPRNIALEKSRCNSWCLPRPRLQFCRNLVLKEISRFDWRPPPYLCLMNLYKAVKLVIRLQGSLHTSALRAPHFFDFFSFDPEESVNDSLWYQWITTPVSFAIDY